MGCAYDPDSLQAYGGIYLDIDVFVLRPFADYSLMVYDTVLGIESKQLDHRRSPATYGEMDPKGLCNAVILSRPNSTFLSRWIDTYDSFNGRLWADHSVVSTDPSPSRAQLAAHTDVSLEDALDVGKIVPDDRDGVV